MKGKLAIFALMLSFSLLLSLPTFAQDNDKPASQDEKVKDRDRDKNVPRPDDRGARQDERRNNRDNDARPQQNQQRVDHPQQEQEEHERHEARPENESRPQRQPNQHADRDRQQRPMEGRRGARIPDDRFHASFGREHRFHVDRARVYQQQQPVVIYSGYTFQLMQPWPAEWSYGDDCYIDYDNVDDQYYLYDAYHPGFRIAVFVVGY